MFSTVQALYLNEPGPGEKVNVQHVFNMDLQRVEMRTVAPVGVGEPLLVYYGEHYPRNYEVSVKPDEAPPDVMLKHGIIVTP